MHPSTAAGEPTPAQDNPQGPPCPRDSDYHPGNARNNGASPEPGTGASLKRGGPGANSQMSSEFAQLVEEPPGGANAGRRASTNPEVEGRHLSLGVADAQAAEFLRNGGWSVISMAEHFDGGGEAIKAKVEKVGRAFFLAPA